VRKNLLKHKCAQVPIWFCIRNLTSARVYCCLSLKEYGRTIIGNLFTNMFLLHQQPLYSDEREKSRPCGRHPSPPQYWINPKVLTQTVRIHQPCWNLFLRRRLSICKESSSSIYPDAVLASLCNA